jgi:hypothetical protein
MREFEASYFPWLELLSSEKKVSEKMGVAYELIQNIRRHQKSEKN